MKRSEKIIVLTRVKKAVEAILSSVFQAIEGEIEKYTVTINGVKYIKSSILKMSIRSIRQESISKIRKLGEGYESE